VYWTWTPRTWTSGSLAFIIAGITITSDMFCKSTNVVYRVDTESARAFLSRFVALP
jgi:hypothetical protein